MLVLPNVIMELSNVRKKKKKPSNVTRVQLHVMFVLQNVMMKLLKMRKKKKRTTKCDKKYYHM